LPLSGAGSAGPRRHERVSDLERTPIMSASEKSLHIDIPVKLSDVKVVFSIGALAFEGDLPASIFHMQLIKNDTRAGARPRRLSQFSIRMPGM
jgi:hypothetical protein